MVQRTVAGAELRRRGDGRLHVVESTAHRVAERLAALKIPFAFVTGYSADVRAPDAYAHKPRLPKPCNSESLAALFKSFRAGS